jgi:drug/metabolite transporter (DMT)-like permease
VKSSIAIASSTQEPLTASKPLWVIATPAIFVILWSGGFAFAKIGLLYAEPLTFLTLRYLVLVFALVVWVIIFRPPPPKSRIELGHQIVVGFFIQAVYFILTYIAFIFGVSAGAFGVIISFQPLLVGLLAQRVAKEQVSWLRWLGLGLGMVGAVIVIQATAHSKESSTIGILASIGALAGMTIGTLYEKRFGSKMHPATSNLIQYSVGLIVCAPLALAMEQLRVNWTPAFIVSLGYLVIANSLISMTLLLAMIRRGEVSRVSALFFLVPPTAAAFAWLLIGEAMPAISWLGMAIALTGVVIASRSALKPRTS